MRNFLFSLAVSLFFYLVCLPDPLFAGCIPSPMAGHCIQNPACTYACSSNGTMAHESCADGETDGDGTNPFCPYHTSGNIAWYCDTQQEAKAICGSGASDPLAGLGCSISSVDSVQHQTRIDWGVGIEGGATITSISNAGTTYGVCGNPVGTSSRPCGVGLTGGSCSSYTVGGTSSSRAGTCYLNVSVNTSAGSKTCTKGVAVNCTPSATTTQIGYAQFNNGNINPTGQAVLNAKTLGQACSDVPSVKYAPHNNEVLEVPTGVDVICVKGKNTSSINDLILVYAGQPPLAAFNIKFANADHDVGYALPVSSLLAAEPTRNHRVYANNANAPEGFCLNNGQVSASLFTRGIITCTSVQPSQIRTPSSSVTTTTATMNWTAPTTWGTKCPQPNVNRYFISLWKQDDGEFKFNRVDIGTATSSNATGLLPDTTYEWRVDTSNNAGLSNTTIGTVQSFTTNAAACSTVQVTGSIVGKPSPSSSVQVCAGGNATNCTTTTSSTYTLTMNPNLPPRIISAPTTFPYYTQSIGTPNPISTGCGGNMTGPTITYTAAFPDLTITPVTDFSIGSGTNGSTTNASAAITNNSINPTLSLANAGFMWNMASSNATCAGPYNSNYTIPALGGFNETTANLTFTLPSPGVATTYWGCVRLDTNGSAPNYQVPESNENNNIFNVSYVVSPSSYFQTNGGDITAQNGAIRNSNPVAGTYLSEPSAIGQQDAGVVISSSSITPSTEISRLGSSPPGVNGVSYPVNTPLLTSSPISGADPTYGTFLDNAIRNLGFANYSALDTPNNYCNADDDTGPLTNNDLIVRGTTTYHLWCTTPTQSLESILNRIVAINETAPAYFHIVVPHPGQLSVPPPITAKNFTLAAKNVLAFVNGPLTVQGDIQTITSGGSKVSTFMAIMNTSTTSLSITGSTTRLDGAYIMPGMMNDNSDNLATPTTLTVRGMLIGTGTNALGSGLRRVPTGVPGEVFVYDARYLAIMNGIITRPTYTWKELTPQ